MLLSLIIPIYKVEEYIEECIESICSQLCEDVEVIVVNDGTPDNSMIIIKKYISENYSSLVNQFVFLDQENQGQSVARNNALAIVKGLYVAFLDSDDYLFKDYIQKIICVIKEQTNIDVIHFNAYRVEDITKKMLSDLIFVEREGEVCKSDNELKEIFNKNYWYPWLRVVRSEIMKDYLFEPNIYLEDLNLFPELYFDFRVKKIFKINKRLVFYRVRSNSSISDPLNKKIIDGLDFGINKFSNSDNKYYDLICSKLLLQRVSLLSMQGKSLNFISNYCREHLRFNSSTMHIFSFKSYLFYKFNIIYLILLKLKFFKVFKSD